MASEFFSDGSNIQGIPEGRLSGEWLFRSGYYHLVTGDLSLLENTSNRWFFERLITNALSFKDLSLLPALRKLTGDKRLSESLRQKASEAAELIEEHEMKSRKPEATSFGIPAGGSLEMARAILSGSRRPPATEILRLLKDKSPGVRRMALYIIGKFRISEMTQEVCMCLSDSELTGDAYVVLRSMGEDAGNDLRRFYLVSSGSTLISASIIRILGAFCTGANMEFINSMLWSGSRYIRGLVLEYLVRCRYVAGKEETLKMIPLVYEVCSTIVWLLSVRICLSRNNNPDLLKEINREYLQWNSFLAGLLKIIDAASLKSLKPHRFFPARHEDDTHGGEIPEIISLITGDPQPEKDGSYPDPSSEEKKFRKLKKYFPSEIPEYPGVLEDIINCDYNIAGLWTKAAAIRSLASLENEDLKETVVALLFSREALLREEAAVILSRYGRNSYDTLSSRLTDRKHTDRIVNGEYHDGELIRNKAIFLSSFFNGINEDLMVPAACRMQFLPGNTPVSGYTGQGFVTWSLTDDGGKPDLVILHQDMKDVDVKLQSGIGRKYSFHYLLPLSALNEFFILHPEHANNILKLLDVNEE